MGREPDVLVTHVLVDVDQDQEARKDQPEYDVRPVRQRVGWIEIRIQKVEDDQYEPRKEKREE
jgi:hypothetical protein